MRAVVTLTVCALLASASSSQAQEPKDETQVPAAELSQRMAELGERIADQRAEIRRLWRAETPDAEKIKAAVRELGELTTALRLARIDARFSGVPLAPAGPKRQARPGAPRAFGRPGRATCGCCGVGPAAGDAPPSPREAPRWRSGHGEPPPGGHPMVRPRPRWEVGRFPGMGAERPAPPPPCCCCRRPGPR